MPSHRAVTSTRPVDAARAEVRDERTELDRRLDDRFDDLIRTFKIWLTLSQLVVVETVALLLLVTRD
jgi:hypothetical protein